MDAIQEALRQKLVEETEALIADGGPAALSTTGRFILHYDPTESWLYEDILGSCPKAEVYYPLAAVLAALEYPDLYTLQEDWNETLGQQGPLPIYLHPTADGHYSAMMAEGVVLRQLLLLTDACDAAMRAPGPHEIGE
jgi:hypothetical protein